MPFLINVWCIFVHPGLDLKIYTLEKDNFADLGPFLRLSVRNGPSVSFGTNIPWSEKKLMPLSVSAAGSDQSCSVNEIKSRIKPIVGQVILRNI